MSAENNYKGKCNMNQEEVERFISVMYDLYNQIVSVETKRYSDNFKISLLSSLVDMMSKSYYGNHYKNRRRFTLFIKEIMEWEFSTYVSLQQLYLAIEKDNRAQFDDLKKFIELKMNSFKKSQNNYLNNDVEIDFIDPYWPEGLKICDKYRLYEFTHANLLYTYRSSLVHELRPPASQSNFLESEQPHYSPRILHGKNSETGELEITGRLWELNYPLTFFMQIVYESIEKLKGKLTESNIDPYEKYDFGDLWIQ